MTNKNKGRGLRTSAPQRIAASQIAAAPVSGKLRPGANFAGVPRAMLDARRWIVWRYVPRKGKPSQKKPVQSGWTEPANWLTHAEAVAACGPREHLGLVLGDGWAGIDVDGAWSDDKRTTLRDHARMVWDACKGAYVERSPSRTGFKVFVRFDEADAPVGMSAERPLPHIGEHVGTEVYSSGRWFAVTGDKLPKCGSDLANPKARKGWRAIYADLRGRQCERVRSIEDADGIAPLGSVRPYTSEREQDLRCALSLLPSDAYKDWVDVGHALKAMGWHGKHGETAFHLWHVWSEKAHNYPGEEACREKWDRDLDPDGSVSVATIFARAKDAAGDASDTVGTRDAALLAELSKPIPLREYTVEDFMGIEPTEPVQLVPGLLAPGLTLLFGRQKSGKTYMLLQLAVALATGGQFLGVRVAKPFRVKVYLLEEAGDAALQRARFAEMGFDDTFRKAPQHKQNLVVVFGDLPPIDKGGLRRLADDLQAFDAVFVDSATALDYGKVGRGELDVFRRHYREFAVLQRAARKPGKCLLVLSHTRKGSHVGKSAPDDISDSTGGKAAAIDAYWALQEDPSLGMWRLTVRGRYKACAPLALCHDKDAGGHWCRLGPWDALAASAAPIAFADEPEDVPLTIAEELVLTLDLLGPSLETADLVGHTDHAESSVLATLRNLQRKGTVTRSTASKRRGATGRPGSVWTLVEL